MVARAPVKIALSGFDGSQQASLELFISRHVDGFELVPEKHAQAMIFNADQPVQLDDLLIQYQSRHSKPGIVVSVNDVSWPGMASLKKPYGTVDLTASLKELTQLLLAQEAPQEPASESDVEDVVAAFRASIHKGEDLGADEQANLARRKNFQQGLMARKRRAEELAAEAAAEVSIESLADVLDQQSVKSTITHDFEHDLLLMTEEVINERAPLPVEQQALASHGVPLLLHPQVQDVQDSCGNLPDLDLSDLSQRRNLFFNPEGQLLSLMLAAQKEGQETKKVQHLVGLPNQRLQYDPEFDAFFSTLAYDTLLQMAQVRFKFGELHLVPAGEDEVGRDNAFKPLSAPALLWRLACYSAKGKLQEGISLARRYQLNDSLPSNVILDLPRTTAIIELWQQESISAVELMERLHVEQRFVFPFMTAAISLGWLN